MAFHWKSIKPGCLLWLESIITRSAVPGKARYIQATPILSPTAENDDRTFWKSYSLVDIGAKIFYVSYSRFATTRDHRSRPHSGGFKLALLKHLKCFKFWNTAASYIGPPQHVSFISASHSAEVIVSNYEK